MSEELEFNFDANAIDAIGMRPTVFKNFCKRYPDDAELGARIREISTEKKRQAKKETRLADTVLVISSCILLLEVIDLLNPSLKKKKHKKVKF